MERLVHLPPDRIDLTTLDGVRAALDLALIDPVERLVRAPSAGEDGTRPG
jgi:hypothetical protein